MTRFRLAYLVTHPIQYQAPLLRLIAGDPEIDFKVFFASDFSARQFIDPDFGQKMSWDVPLLEGYDYEILPQWGRGLRASEVPDFWHPFSHGLATRLAGRFDYLWIHGYNRAAHVLAMITARRLGLKILLRDEATAISAARSPLKRRVKRGMFAALDRLIDAYLAIGSLNQRYYQQLGVAQDKIFMMPYAVDNQFFQSRIDQSENDQSKPGQSALRQSLGIEPGHPIVLFAGKLIRRKRPLDLLNAFIRLDKPEELGLPYLLVAGDGPLMPVLKQRIEAEKLARVRLLGLQSQAELAQLYALTDLFVLPSERESWGLVVNEAMNAGAAIIASDRIGAATDLIVTGRNGYTFPVGDIAALTDCLRFALEDPEQLRRMKTASRQIIQRWSFAEDLVGLKAALGHLAGAR